MPDSCIDVTCPHCDMNYVRQINISRNGAVRRQYVKCPFCRSQFVIAPSRDNPAMAIFEA